MRIDPEFLQGLLEHGGFFADKFFLTGGISIFRITQAIPVRQVIFTQFLRRRR